MSEQPGDEGLRVVSWNVRALQGDPLAAHRVIRHLRPDVLCLQEVPRWVTPGWRLGALARATGLLVAGSGRAAAGNAVLVSWRTEVSHVQVLRLPYLGTDRQYRGAVLLRAGMTGRPSVAVAAVHLSLQQPERLRHVALLTEKLAGYGLPALAAGDMNETPGGPTWRAWEPLLHDPWTTGDADRGPGATFPSWGPQHRIDGVLVSAGLQVTSYGDGEIGPAGLAGDVRAATDHWPVLAVVRPGSVSQQEGPSVGKPA